jgi:predicted nucleic acid-binding protein
VILIADTSGIIAASDKNAPKSAGCQAALADAGTVLVSPLVLAEVDHLALARFGGDARSSLIDFILFQARREYAGLSLDLADAVNVSLAAEYRTNSVLTLDRRDFRAIRPLTPHPAFQLLPDDM